MRPNKLNILENNRLIILKAGFLALATSVMSLAPSAQAKKSKSEDREGTYRIEIRVTNEERDLLARNKKTEVESANLVVFKPGDTVGESFTVKISTRGVTSLGSFPRKNFNIKSIIPKEVEGDESMAKVIKVGNIKGKSLVLSASPEDILGTKNMVAYGILKAAGVRALQPHYSEVVINDVSQGLYFVTRSSGDEILKEKVMDAEGQKTTNPYEVVIRRRYGDFIEAIPDKDGVIKVKGMKKGLDPAVLQDYIETLKAIHALPDERIMGATLEEKLSENLNWKAYMRWMAVNYILKNGDYSDEVFFFGKRVNGKIMFDVLPWDQDDSFSEGSHQANIVASVNHGMEKEVDQTLVHNFESKLDRAVAGDSYLLRKYMEVVMEVIQEFRAKDVPRKVVEKVTEKLMPYLDIPAVLEAGKLDKQVVVLEKGEDPRPHDKAQVLAGLQGRIEAIEAQMAKAESQIALNRDMSDQDLAVQLSLFKRLIGDTFLHAMQKATQK